LNRADVEIKSTRRKDVNGYDGIRLDSCSFLTATDPDSTIRTTLKVVMFRPSLTLEDEESRMDQDRG
jgi:hypothetical protein